MKNINIKIPESELERLNYYRAQPETGISACMQADFIRDAAAKKCDDLRLHRAGGLVMTFPNPSNSGMPRATMKMKIKVLEIIKQADADLAKAGFVGSGFSEYATWLEYHLLEKTDRQQKIFEQNFERDLRVEATIADLEDAEWEEQQKRLEAKWGESRSED